MQFVYRIFGLNFNSEIELPYLKRISTSSIDFSIIRGFVPTHLPNICDKGILYETGPNDFLFKMDAICSYRVQNGNLITVQPKDESRNDELHLFLMGSVMGALLQQRSILTIHGSSIVKQDEAIVFAGFAASGKSTLVATLDKRGYSVASDDISAIAINKKNNCLLYTGLPYIKLWKDVKDSLNFNDTMFRVRPQLEKYIIPTQNQSEGKYEVTKIFILQISNNQDYMIEEIIGAEKFNLLKTHTYRQKFLFGQGKMEIYFNNLAILAKSTKMFLLKRPPSPLMIDEFANFVEEQVIYQF